MQLEVSIGSGHLFWPVARHGPKGAGRAGPKETACAARLVSNRLNKKADKKSSTIWTRFLNSNFNDKIFKFQKLSIWTFCRMDYAISNTWEMERVPRSMTFKFPINCLSGNCTSLHRYFPVSYPQVWICGMNLSGLKNPSLKLPPPPMIISPSIKGWFTVDLIEQDNFGWWTMINQSFSLDTYSSIRWHIFPSNK